MTPSVSPETAERTCVVIAAYNEATRIGNVLRELRLTGITNIVVVDDGSSDDSAKIAAAYNVWVLRHSINRGQGAALQTGIDFAIAKGHDFIVTFDADGQHVADDIPCLLGPLHNKTVDVVLGSRFLGTTTGIPVLRKWLLRVAVGFTRVSTRLALTDTHNGLRAMTAHAASHLRMTEDGMAHASEFLSKLAKSSLLWREAPVTIRYTRQSIAKGQRNRAAFEIAFRMVVARLVQ